jgi:hypothetical protein
MLPAYRFRAAALLLGLFGAVGGLSVALRWLVSS